MIKRTSVKLQLDLVEEASAILGTSTTVDTIHRALEEVVRRGRLRRLANEPFADLNDEALQALRAQRLEYLEDSLGALSARNEPDALVPWSEVREPDV